jgi:tetratricopeptide (TPR) repeat protein
LLNGGDPDKAMEAFQEAKHMFSARFGEDSEKVVTVMSYIGSTLVRLGRHEEALDEYRKAADAIGRRQSGGLVLADVLNQCGVCCWMCDRLDDALDFYTEVIRILHIVRNQSITCALGFPC